MNKPYSGNYRRYRSIHNTFSALLMGAAISLVGCATTAATDQQNLEDKAENNVDPYENFNRKMYGFNDKVDNYVAEPISDAYRWITPQFMQTGVSNFFNNLKNINVVINDVLQAKFQQSAQDSGRFAINTTVGLAGLLDVAKHVGWEQNDEDFDQTLAVWGVPQGSYLVIPFLGPSTARGIPGSIFDTAANPATYVGLPVQLVSMLNTRANAEGALKFIDEAALDPYVFTRESFLQWRNNLATDGKAEASDLSGFEDELDDESADSVDAKKNASAEKPALASDESTAQPQLTKASARQDSQSEPAKADAHQFVQVADSFGGVEQSFDDATKSFEEAAIKLDQLQAKQAARKYKKSKGHRKAR